MSKSRRLIELKEKNYSHVKKKTTTKTELHYQLHSLEHSQTNLQSQYVIYLMECILCKIQYVVKSETPFNLRLNNHRKDANNLKAILACNHFKMHGHNFMKYTKFTLTE